MTGRAEKNARKVEEAKLQWHLELRYLTDPDTPIDDEQSSHAEIGRVLLEG